MQPTKCIGIWGRLFGHKFHRSNLDYHYSSQHCYRCGMPQGGWPIGKEKMTDD